MGCVVLYFHGAGGLSPDAYRDIDVALKAGVAIIAINSYAQKRPYNPCANLSYTSSQGECGRAVEQILSIRKAEIVHALDQVRHVPWVDQNNIFAWGHSEGGGALASFSGAVFKGHIITGSGCQHGFKAKEPVLAILSRNDPYKSRFIPFSDLATTCLQMSGNPSNLTYVDLPGNLHNGG